MRVSAESSGSITRRLCLPISGNRTGWVTLKPLLDCKSLVGVAFAILNRVFHQVHGKWTVERGRRGRSIIVR